MANKKVPTEAGNTRGHSNMAHSLHTDEIKTSARKARRRADRAEVDAEQRPARPQLKPIPKFASEAEERAFWETHDTVDYIDWTEAVLYEDHTSPPLRAIYVWLPEPMIAKLKELGRAKSIPFQKLARSYIAAGIEREEEPARKPAKAKKRKVG